MDRAHAAERGAVGLDLGDGKNGKEMIDAPMLKQVMLDLILLWSFLGFVIRQRTRSGPRA